ncbi:cytochrome c-type biogenesis protein [Neoroseomonas lacus]|uniref:cytochrome c-type biogenesis protein n=1 Tax=Neoroseomonas lacus TaxID=287609 RepID=UPI0027E42A10|nr:cytochrome c-type biogenesis protein CcmH [Neoroseomonas lacus]
MAGILRHCGHSRARRHPAADFADEGHARGLRPLTETWHAALPEATRIDAAIPPRPTPSIGVQRPLGLWWGRFGGGKALSDVTAAAVVLLVLLLAALPALAAVGRPEDRLQDPALEARAEAIGRDLRCMVCQNQSIEDSDAELARDLRRLVRERVSAGDSDAKVVDFIHDRYGDFVLLRPPFNPVTALLWAMPLIAFGGGALVILARRRRTAAGIEPAPLTEAERKRLGELERGNGA